MTVSVLTVLTPATSRALTTLGTAKDELGISGTDDDARLSRWIDEASERIETYLGRVLASETVREIFRVGGAAPRRDIDEAGGTLGPGRKGCHDGTPDNAG